MVARAFTAWIVVQVVRRVRRHRRVEREVKRVVKYLRSPGVRWTLQDVRWVPDVEDGA